MSTLILPSRLLLKPDRAWPAKIGWAQANLGRPLDADDSAVARAS